MKLQVELAITVLGFAGLNLLLAFVSIGLFARMGPAVELIMLRNDATIEAAEEVLMVFADASGRDFRDEERRSVAAAMERIARNVTEEQEPAAVESVERFLGPAMEGDRAARTALFGALRRLLEINRDAMLEADHEAQRLGSAGAWAAAFVAIASLAMSVALGRRLVRRVVRPVTEFRRVLAAVRSGDRYRRCSGYPAPVEIRDAMGDLNKLLDSWGDFDETPEEHSEQGSPA